MTATNHALTGAVVALAITNPALALPIAFASHFVLDSLPHYGESIQRLSTFTKRLWTIDFIAVSLLLLFLLLQGSWVLVIGALLAASPDIVWVYRYGYKEKFGKLPPAKMNRFNAFHSAIQKYEFRGGVVIEIGYFGLLVTLFYQMIH